jgi:hypothetical protein
MFDRYGRILAWESPQYLGLRARGAARRFFLSVKMNPYGFGISGRAFLTRHADGEETLINLGFGSINLG